MYRRFQNRRTVRAEFAVHQSFLVNYKHVEGIRYDFLVLDNGKRISISEDRRKTISEQYCEMEDSFYVDR